MFFKPRQFVQYLQQSPILQLKIFLTLPLIYLIQFGAFVLSLKKITLAPLLTLKGLVLTLQTLFFLAIAALIAVVVLTLVLWVATRCFNGQGSIFQTRSAILSTLVGLLPIGFFFLLLSFAFYHQHWATTALLCRIVSYIGTVVAVVYSFIILLTTVSEIHGFGLWRAFFSIVLTLLSLSVLIYGVLSLI